MPKQGEGGGACGKCQPGFLARDPVSTAVIIHWCRGSSRGELCCCFDLLRAHSVLLVNYVKRDFQLLHLSASLAAAFLLPWATFLLTGVPLNGVSSAWVLPRKGGKQCWKGHNSSQR